MTTNKLILNIIKAVRITVIKVFKRFKLIVKKMYNIFFPFNLRDLALLKH